MKSFRGRPVITDADHPRVIASALRESLPWYGENEPSKAWAWGKVAADSYESVEDVFMLHTPGDTVPLSAEATLYMTPDQLALALVIYGLAHHSDVAEVRKVDELLRSTDELKA